MIGNSNGHDDSDGSGGSELVEVTHPVSLTESHPEQQLEQLEVLTRAHNLLELEVIWGI